MKGCFVAGFAVGNSVVAPNDGPEHISQTNVAVDANLELLMNSKFKLGDASRF